MKRIIVAVLACLLMMSCWANAAVSIDSMANAVVRDVNLERAKYGLPGLRTDPELTAAARLRAQEIVQKFSHTRPDGTSWRTISEHAYGENIARGQKTADKVMAAWLSSDGHRKNILRTGFASIGVACVKSNNIYYWVQIFGK